MLISKSRAISLFALLAAVLLGACDTEPGINEQPRLLSPQSTYAVHIRGVRGLSGLEVRVTGTAVTAVLEDRVSPEREGDAVWFNDEVIAVTAVEEGTGSVELFLEGDSIGVVEFTVRQTERLAAVGLDSRDAADMRYVTAGPLAFTPAFVLRAFDAMGNEFDGARETVGEVVSEDPNTEIDFQQTIFGLTGFAVDFATPGTHELEVRSEAGDLVLPFEAVDPADVVSLRMEAGESQTRFTVYGVTADGTLVGNLRCEFSVDGQSRGTMGNSLVDHELPQNAAVEATWNGLSVRR